MWEQRQRKGGDARFRGRGPGKPSSSDEVRRWLEETLEDEVVIPDVPPPPPPREVLDALSPSEQSQFKEILEELHRREFEALTLYEPMAEQERFHACEAGERLVLGSNRSGKTLCSCVEIARAITNQDPYHKFSESDGRFAVVGKDLLHCGQVIYRKLFRPGAFKVIYDPFLCKVRAFRPHLPWDHENEEQAKAAPPLIPSRHYRATDVSWNNKREEIPTSVKIRSTGWQLNFFSGLAAPPQGWDLNAAAFDEEIEHPQWYLETAARLPDRRVRKKGGVFLNGRFHWAATPQAGTQHLYDLYERAERAASEAHPRPKIVGFHLSIDENKHIDQEAKDDLKEKLISNEDEYEIRIAGKFAILGARIYPELMPKGVHFCPTFVVPEDWTTYAALDPGRQVCAMLFVAVPPPYLDSIAPSDGGDPWPVRGRKVIFDELYIRRCNAAIFAERLKARLGRRVVHGWWIDLHAGRIHEMGSGITVEQQYSAALKKLKLGCESSGPNFAWSNDDVRGGIESVRSGLHVTDGRAEWAVMSDKVPNFIDEAKKYSYKRKPGTKAVTDDPLQQNNHLMDCWRYLAMNKLPYRKPRPARRAKGYTIAALEEKRAKQRSRDGKPSIKLY